MRSLLPIAGVHAAINLGSYPIDQTLVSDRTKTVKYEATTNFKTCTCDRTFGSCDAFCCCDQECPEAARTQWTASSQCADVVYQKDMTKMNDLGACLNSTAAYEYNSQRGMTEYFGPFEQLMCVSINNSRTGAQKTLNLLPSLKKEKKLTPR